MFDRGVIPHRPPHDHKLHPRHTQMLPWVSELRTWTMDLVSGVVVQGWWCRYVCAIPPLATIMWVMNYIWQGCNTPQTTAWPQNTPQIRLAVTLDIGIKSLNHIPHQWCSGPRMMIPVWTCYPTIILVLYKACTTSDRGGSPNRPQYDFQLHPRHTQLLPWTLEQIVSSTMYLVSGVFIVVQG